MTILSCVMRDAGRHSHLADIATIRLLMSLGGLVPLPSDALVTPVTFRVRKRQLRGILSDFDTKEDGKRELCGEWVVGKRTWQRLQHEWKHSKAAKSKAQQSSGLPGQSTRSTHSHSSKKKERVVLYLHGGAYYAFSPQTHRMITIPLSKALDARLFALDYRLAPETRFPGPLHDAVSAYFRMIDDLNIRPENIIVAGDSAGGGLSLALMMYLRDNGYPLPGGAILMSPWVDLTMSCDSWESNAAFDIVPMPQPGDHLNPIACYLGEHMEKYLTHPYASPLFGDLKGLPPLLIQGGDSEVLRDEITLLAHKAGLAGVDVRHELYEDALHVFQSMPFLDAARRAFISAREFVRDVLNAPPPPSSMTPQPELTVSAEEHLESEIDNESARVVSGDGVSRGVDKAEMMSLGLGLGGLPTPEKTDSEGFRTPEEDPSWINVTESPWSIATAAGSASTSSVSAQAVPGGEKGTKQEAEKENLLVPTRPATPAPTEKKINTSPRRHSTASSALYTSAGTSPSFSPGRHRAPSSSYQQLPNPTLLNPFSHTTISSSQSMSNSPTSSPRPPSRGLGLGLSRISMSSMAAPAPRPSIRRSHSSHPDITQLCQSWDLGGPANMTTTFKPEMHGVNSGSGGIGGSMRRKASLNFSEVAPGGVGGEEGGKGKGKKRYYI